MTEGVGADVEGRLGRRFHSSKNAGRAQRGNPPYSEFMPKQGQNDISVDGLRLTALGRLNAVAVEDAKEAGRTFYGWAHFPREIASEEGRRLHHTPRPPKNPDHHEVHLPKELTHNREALKHHASALATSSEWLAAGVVLLRSME